MKTDIEVIDEAIALVEKDGGWCQGAFFYDKNGWPTDGRSGKPPASFCVEGAIAYACGVLITYGVNTPVGRAAHAQSDRLRRLVAKQGVPEPAKFHGFPRDFNDAATTTQEDVVLALKKTRNWLENQ